MDAPGRVSNARVGEGARRVQPDRARLQSPAHPQYRGAAKADRRAPSLKATSQATSFGRAQSIVAHHGIGQLIRKPNPRPRKTYSATLLTDTVSAATVFPHGLRGFCET